MAGKLAPVPDYEYIGVDPKHGESLWQRVNQGWKPGKYGKGFIMNGELYTWVVDSYGNPNHHAILQTFFEGKRPDDYIAEIHPDGGFESWDRKYDSLIQTNDPRLKPSSGWKVASDDKPVNLIQVNTLALGGNRYLSRQPFAYFPKTQTIALGQPGGHHADLELPGETHHAIRYDGWIETPEHHYRGPGVHFYTSDYVDLSPEAYHALHEYAHPEFKPWVYHPPGEPVEDNWKFADFWEDQRKENFPEDFEEDELNQSKPMSVEEIKARVEKGNTLYQQGKSVHFADGYDIAWDVDKNGDPHHDQVVEALGLEDRPVKFYGILTEDGTEEDAYGFLHDLWSFKQANTHNWDEGHSGKGLLLRDGTLITWNDEEYPFHDDYIAEHPEIDVGGAHYLYIWPNGKCSTAWGTLTEENEQEIRDHDPRLYVDVDTGRPGTWQFGR